jgi:two-component sensor histidine kinase
VLSIADDGDGMQAASDGTGLSIVRALVRDELGGELTLRDEQGLCAEVRFPARSHGKDDDETPDR